MMIGKLSVTHPESFKASESFNVSDRFNVSWSSGLDVQAESELPANLNVPACIEECNPSGARPYLQSPNQTKPGSVVVVSHVLQKQCIFHARIELKTY
jgi:hypothetical protein